MALLVLFQLAFLSGEAFDRPSASSLCSILVTQFPWLEDDEIWVEGMVTGETALISVDTVPSRLLGRPMPSLVETGDVLRLIESGGLRSSEIVPDADVMGFRWALLSRIRDGIAGIRGCERAPYTDRLPTSGKVVAKGTLLPESEWVGGVPTLRAVAVDWEPWTIEVPGVGPSQPYSLMREFYAVLVPREEFFATCPASEAGLRAWFEEHPRARELQPMKSAWDLLANNRFCKTPE